MVIAIAVSGCTTSKHKSKAESLVAPKAQPSGGTGFFLTKDLIISCKHVIKPGNDIVIFQKTADGQEVHAASSAWYSPELDFCLLQIPPGLSKAKPLPISQRILNVGEPVYSLGYAEIFTMWSGKEPNLLATAGHLSSKQGRSGKGQGGMIAVSTPLQSGNSGGPLFDKYGEVIAITAERHPGLRIENLNFGIKIKRALTEVGLEVGETSYSTRMEMDLENIFNSHALGVVGVLSIPAPSGTSYTIHRLLEEAASPAKRASGFSSLSSRNPEP